MANICRSPPPPLTWQMSRFIDSKLILLFFSYYIIQVLYFFSLLVMDFETMMHGRENIKYEKAIQQFGHNNPPPPPHPNQYLPWGSHFRYIFFYEKRGNMLKIKNTLTLCTTIGIYFPMYCGNLIFWIWPFQSLLLIFTKKNGYKLNLRLLGDFPPILSQI